VELVDRNWIVDATLSSTPDDTHFSDQWHLDDAGDVDIDAPEAWDVSTGSSEVIVAMVDTGIDIDHADLVGNLWTNADEAAGSPGVDDDGNGYIDDVHGYNFKDDNASLGDIDDHGTFSAGLAGAVGDNNQDVTGTAWTVKLMIVRIFTDQNPSQADIVEALQYAADNGAKIVNNSWNWEYDLPLVRAQIEDLQEEDVLFVFSAGNGPDGDFDGGVDIDDEEIPAYLQGEPSDPHLFPCKFQIANMICVAAVGRDGNKPSFSNWGVNSVHLSAPGKDMWSTTNGGGSAQGACGTGCRDDGTSWAAPQVSGVAALMVAARMDELEQKQMQYTGYPFRELKENLLAASQPVSTGHLDGRTHTGRMLNARAAIKAFGDTFDDAADGSLLYSDSPTSARWAALENSLCDTEVDTISGTQDRAVRVGFTATTSWTAAVYKVDQDEDYLPGSEVQTVLMRVTTIDASDFTQKKGRIGTGVVGKTSTDVTSCSGETYTEVAIGGSVIGGIDLTTGKPFVYFDPPYDERLSTEDSIDLSGVCKLSISLGLGSGFVELTISDSTNGDELYRNVYIPYPGTWNWTGSDRMAFLYYGTSGVTGSHELLVREVVSLR
jgi:subtilisin family serine protease